MWWDPGSEEILYGGWDPGYVDLSECGRAWILKTTGGRGRVQIFSVDARVFAGFRLLYFEFGCLNFLSDF